MGNDLILPMPPKVQHVGLHRAALRDLTASASPGNG